jgi:hypothetical protein
MNVEEGTEFELVFEGPSDNLPETLRRIKAVFIAELEYEIASVQKFLSEAPVRLLTTDDESEALAISSKLNSAGAKVTIIRSKKTSPQEQTVPPSIEIDLDDFIVAPHTEKNQPVNTYLINLPEENNPTKKPYSSVSYHPDDAIKYEDEDQYFQESYDDEDADIAVEELLQQLSTPLVNQPPKEDAPTTPNTTQETLEEDLKLIDEEDYDTSQTINSKNTTILTEATNILPLKSSDNDRPLYEIEDDKSEKQISSSVSESPDKLDDAQGTNGNGDNYPASDSVDKTLTPTENISPNATVTNATSSDTLDKKEIVSQTAQTTSSNTEEYEESQNIPDSTSYQTQSADLNYKNSLVAPSILPLDELGEKPAVLVSIAKEIRSRDPIRRLIVPVSLMLSIIFLVALVTFFTNQSEEIPNFDLDSTLTTKLVTDNFSLSDASVLHGTKTDKNYTVAATCLVVPKLAGKCAITINTPPPRELTPQEIVDGKFQPPWLYRTETGAFVVSQQGAEENLLSGSGISRVFIQYKGSRVRVPGNHSASLIFNELNKDYLISVKIFSKDLPDKVDINDVILIEPNLKGDHRFLIDLSIPVKLYADVDPLTVSLEKGTFNPPKK